MRVADNDHKERRGEGWGRWRGRSDFLTLVSPYLLFLSFSLVDIIYIINNIMIIKEHSGDTCLSIQYSIHIFQNCCCSYNLFIADSISDM